MQVYRQILEFYKVAFEILTKKGAKLVMKLVLETDRLPGIVQEFLRHARNLGKLVQNATWEIVEDIKSMLYDRESKSSTSACKVHTDLSPVARWLDSGRMSQQSQYHTSLQEICAGDACEFLLRDKEFIDWYRAPDSRKLVILGDMGYGKTVSMAFLIDVVSRRSEHQLPQPKLCYYYCRDDESSQPTRILCALILALLEQLPGLKKTFFGWYKQAQASGIFDPSRNVGKLEEFLQDVVGDLDRPLFIMVDGLDECDSSSRVTLLSVLRGLTERTPRLKVLLSSRPQEEILVQLGNTARIDLVSNTGRDRIIVMKTVEARLTYLTEDVKALVVERLSGMAQGNSIWTRTMVELIERRGIRAFVPMSRFLDTQMLPRGISELYNVLLSRCTSDDPENHDLATAALRVLATARRSLSMLELSWAVMLGVAEEASTVAEISQLVDHKRLVNLIQPFVSRVDFSDAKKRQLRLVHQSVKEWIIDYWVPGLPHIQHSASSITPSKAATRRRLEILESHMLDICVRCLLLDEVNSINLFSEEQVAIENLPQTSDLFTSDDEGLSDYDVNCSWEAWEEGVIRYDPTERGLGEFFVYASCYWVDHYGAISVGPLPDLGKIEKLCQAGSTRLHNWIEQNRRPDCAINPRFEFDSTLYDPLSITSMYGSQAMLQHMLDSSDFDGDAYLPHSVMGAVDQIIRWADMSRLRIILLESRWGNQVQIIDFFRLIMGHWTNFGMWRHDWDKAFNLVDEVTDRLVCDGLGNELLCQASKRGCMPIIRRLIGKSRQHAQLRRELLYGTRLEKPLAPPAESIHQSIGEAVMRGHIDVVEYLLREEGIEAHVTHVNSRGENVLHLASQACNPDIFRLLIPLFLDGVHQKDNHGETPLKRVIKSSAVSDYRHVSARILLTEGGRGENAYSLDELQECLREAARLEDVDMCGLLMEVDGTDLPLVFPNGGGELEISDPPAGDHGQVENLQRLQHMHANTASVIANSTAPLGEQEGQSIPGRAISSAQLVRNAAR